MRQTKIICTIGPKTCALESLQKLAEGGMNIARLNMSHGTHNWHQKVIQNIQAINQKGNHSIAIMIDTKGPEVRSGDLKEEIFISKGDSFTFTIRRQAEYEMNTTEVSYDGFIEDVKEGDIILVDGGILSMKVVSKTNTDVICECRDSGKMSSRRHLNIQGKSAKLPSITEKDWEDIDFGIKQGVNFFALSFVHNQKAIRKLKKYLEEKKAPIQVIAKIESANSIPNINEIIAASDGVMVARGDLGSELPLEEVPLLQQEIIEICREMGTPVIVATHLLESMIIHPTPTRAEASDVSHAVMQKVDAVMLSGETAAGNYPFKALKVLDRITKRIEKKLKEDTTIHLKPESTKESLVMSASIIANSLKNSAIIVITKRGSMAALLSKCRPNPPIFAFASTDPIRKKLNLFRGVHSFQIELFKNPEKTIQKAIDVLKEKKRIKENDKVIVVSDILAGEQRVETVQIRKIQ